MKTHKVLDTTYHEDEGQDTMVGTLKECNDFVASQSDHFMYQVVPLTDYELEIYNKEELEQKHRADEVDFWEQHKKQITN